MKLFLAVPGFSWRELGEYLYEGPPITCYPPISIQEMSIVSTREFVFEALSYLWGPELELPNAATIFSGKWGGLKGSTTI
jgi:hypothetical protein